VGGRRDRGGRGAGFGGRGGPAGRGGPGVRGGPGGPAARGEQGARRGGTPGGPDQEPGAGEQGQQDGGRGPGSGRGRGLFGGHGGVIPHQDVAEVSKNWPAGKIDIRMANFLAQAQQKWSVTAVSNAGGYLGSPYFKITIVGTDRALAATEEGELVALPAFTG